MSDPETAIRITCGRQYVSGRDAEKNPKSLVGKRNESGSSEVVEVSNRNQITTFARSRAGSIGEPI